MKNIIFFFGSFDPLHKGHISIAENAIKKVNADILYLGLNKSSSKGKLTSLYHRKKMLHIFSKTNNKYKVLDFTFDYKNIDKTYENIFNIANTNDNYYILIGQDQLMNLDKWYKFDTLINKFSFIIAKRGDIEISDSYLNNDKYIFIDHNYKEVSSTFIKNQKYTYTHTNIAEYIISHNLYLKSQIRKLLDEKRYNHTLSVSKTALKLNRECKLGLNKYVVEKAALLHDIAKNIDKNKTDRIIREYYKEYINEDENILHQYVGEYLAREDFFVYDDAILKAIKYHTTGRSNMSLLEKLIYVSDKIEPTRNYDTSYLLNECLKDFNNGFKKVLENNKNHLISKNTIISNQDSLNCFKYYLK